jgi:hypothetical protein
MNYDKIINNKCYLSLKTYNNINKDTLNPPIPESTEYGYYNVPLWNYRPSYNTLAKNGNNINCIGYYNIKDAYGIDSSVCEPKYSNYPCV